MEVDFVSSGHPAKSKSKHPTPRRTSMPWKVNKEDVFDKEDVSIAKFLIKCSVKFLKLYECF